MATEANHPSMSEAINAYLKDIVHSRTENVVANHVSLSKRFLEYFSEMRPVASLDKLRPQDVAAFLNWHTHRRGRFTDHTYNMGVEFIKCVTRYGLAKGWMKEDPAAEIAYKEIETPVPEVLSRDEMESLLKTATKDDFSYILVSLFGQVGLKKQEVVGLFFSDLELDGDVPEVVIRYSGKLQKKSRRLAISNELAAAMRNYHMRRQMLGTGGPLDLLVQITGRQVNNILVQLCREAGVRRANPQILRDTAAVHLLASGRPPEDVGRRLGYTPRGYLLEFLPRFEPWIPAAGD